MAPKPLIQSCPAKVKSKFLHIVLLRLSYFKQVHLSPCLSVWAIVITEFYLYLHVLNIVLITGTVRGKVKICHTSCIKILSSYTFSSVYITMFYDKVNFIL